MMISSLFRGNNKGRKFECKYLDPRMKKKIKGLRILCLGKILSAFE